MEKRNICLTITQIRRSQVNFGNNLREAKAKKVRFYFVTLKWHRSTCYVNWAIITKPQSVGSDDLLKSPESPKSPPKSPLNLLKSGLMVYIIPQFIIISYISIFVCMIL